MTLAQDIIDTKQPTLFGPKETVETEYKLWPAVQERLRAPDRVDVLKAHKTAFRLVYIDDLSILANELHKSGQITSETVQKAVRLPHKITWIEWPDMTEKRGESKTLYPCKLGILLEEAGDGYAFISFMKIEGKILPIQAGSLWGLPTQGTEGSRVHIEYADLGIDEHAYKEAKQIISTAAFGLVVSSIPKAIDPEDVVPAEKLNRIRKQKKREALVEFRVVRVKLLERRKQRRKLAEQAAAGTGEPTGKKAWHLVEGHFKPVKCGPKWQDVRIQWVEEYERGDPSLGIILKEKRISV